MSFLLWLISRSIISHNADFSSTLLQMAELPVSITSSLSIHLSIFRLFLHLGYHKWCFNEYGGTNSSLKYWLHFPQINTQKGDWRIIWSSISNILRNLLLFSIMVASTVYKVSLFYTSSPTLFISCLFL